MKKYNTVKPVKWLVFALVLVCSFYVPMSSKTTKASGVARVGYANGFNEQFTTSASNWFIVSGKWTYGSGVFRGNAVASDTSSVFFKQAEYANFDFQVKMRRKGCSGCDNSLSVRNCCARSLNFHYDNLQRYSIIAETGIGYKTIQPSTKSTAIISGGFNVLRVVAIGNAYEFYVNNKLLKKFTYFGQSSGHVGIEFFAWETKGNYIEVDYAILKTK